MSNVSQREMHLLIAMAKFATSYANGVDVSADLKQSDGSVKPSVIKRLQALIDAGKESETEVSSETETLESP